MALIFNENTPQAAQTIASSQSEIQTNFASINTAFNDANPLRFTKYAMQDVNPVAAPADPIGILHMLNGANFFLNKPIPYFRNSVGDFPILPDYKTTTTGAITNYGFRFGNIIVNFGTGTTPGPNSTAITMALAFTGAGTYAAIAGPNNGAALNEGTWDVSKTGAQTITVFRGFGITGAVAISYFAIGI